MAIAAIIPALITAAAGIYGSVKANQANRKLYEEQRAWQEQQRDEQNLYNSPVQQMSRLKEAGLNPHLIYSNGGATMPSATAGTVQPPEIKNPLANLSNSLIYQQLKNLRAEENSIKSQSKNIQADTLKKQAETSLITEQAETQLELTMQARWNSSIAELNYQDRVNEIQYNAEYRKLSLISQDVLNDISKADRDIRRQANDLEVLAKMLSNEYVQSQLVTENFRRSLLQVQTLSESERANYISSLSSLNEVQKEILERVNRIGSATEAKDTSQFTIWSREILQQLNTATGIVGNLKGLPIMPSTSHSQSQVIY